MLNSLEFRCRVQDFGTQSYLMEDTLVNQGSATIKCVDSVKQVVS